MTVAKIDKPVYERTPATYQQMAAAGKKLFDDPLPENQQGWQKLMREHGQGVCDLLNKVSWNDPRLLRFYEAAFKVGLFGSNDYFETIPSRLPSQIIDKRPEFVITRIVLDPTDHDEQLLIQGPDGEPFFFQRLGPLASYGHDWSINGAYRQVNITVHPREPVELHNPRLLTFYEEYIRISVTTEMLFKVEATARATLGCIGFSSGVNDVALGYLGYPSQAEKARAKIERVELQKSMVTSVANYFLPKA